MDIFDLSPSCQPRQTSMQAQEQKKQTEPHTLNSLLQRWSKALIAQEKETGGDI